MKQEEYDVVSRIADALTDLALEFKAFMKGVDAEDYFAIKSANPVYEPVPEPEPLSYDEWLNRHYPFGLLPTWTNEQDLRFFAVEYARYLCGVLKINIHLDGEDTYITGPGTEFSDLAKLLGSDRLHILQNLFTVHEKE